MKKILFTIILYSLIPSVYSQKTARIKKADAVCDSVLFNYTLKSTLDKTLGGITYNWTRFEVNGIANTSASGSGVNIQEYLVNTTNEPIIVNYLILMTLPDNNCPHEDTLRVLVKPTPHLSSAKAALICDSSLFVYTPTSTVSGSLFSWTRPSIYGITNPGTNGQDGISERLIDTAFKIIQVPYYYKTIANGCWSNDTLGVTVVPRPFGSINLSNDSIYSGNPTRILFKTTDTIPYQFAWKFGDGQLANTKINPVEHYYYTRQTGRLPISVLITNKYGCVNSFISSIKIIGDSTPRPVDTIAVLRHYSFQVFPVPFNQDLKLKYSLVGPSETAMYIVNDLSGRIVYAQPLELKTGNNIIKLPSEKLINGIVYVVKIQSKSYQYEEKVYKK